MRVCHCFSCRMVLSTAATDFIRSACRFSMLVGGPEIEKLSWENFNEGATMKESIERYRQTYGCYPEVVLVDKLYRNRENIRYCQERGIRITGPRLGRKTAQIQKEERKIMIQDARVRNKVEGKSGEGKRKYGLGLIRGKVKETSETMIVFALIAMNLARCLRGLFFSFFQCPLQ